MYKSRSDLYRKSVFTIILITASTLLLGCVGERIAENQDLQAEVEELLTVRGFDTSDLKYLDDGTVVVEGDIVMYVDDVLSYADQDTEKGWWTGGGPNATANATQTIYTYATSYVLDNLDEDWQWAIVAAMKDWNDNTPLTFKADADPPENAQEIIWRGYNNPNDIVDGSVVLARATWPRDGKPGRFISINLGAPNINALPYDRKKACATHEIGHNLGFTHPGEGVHISQTASTGYDTVMKQSNGEQSTNLTEDDIDSAYALYLIN